MFTEHPRMHGRPRALFAVCLSIAGVLAAAAGASAATDSASAPAPAAPAATEAAPLSGVGMAGARNGRRVPHGRTVRITGFVAPRTAGAGVRLEHAPRGRGYRPVKRTRTRRNGSYRFVVRARRSGSYRAVAEPGAEIARTARAVASRPLRVTVVARVGGRATRHAIGGQAVRVRGRLKPALRGRLVRLQLRTRRGWATLKRARTKRGGRFSARWRPPSPGSYRLRLRFAGDRAAATGVRRLGSTHVYRAGHASWYGPGFYGNTTACGSTLTYGRLGVAHKWLPCGTRVTFRYRGRSVTVPVIDRGPYAAGRDWDLTAATKARLGFGSTGTVWSTR